VIKRIGGTNLGEHRYEVRGRNGGKYGKQFRRRFRTKKEAEAFELQRRNQEARRKSGIPEPLPAITYADLVAKFLAQNQTESKQWLGEMLDYSLRIFGEIEVRQLRPEDIAQWTAHLPVGLTTQRHALATMRQLLAKGVIWKYLDENPARAELVPTPKAGLPQIHPFESWADVFAAADAASRYRPLVIFACATGMRPEEWAALYWSDIDWGRKAVRVARTVVDGRVKQAGKTDGSLRQVRLQEIAVDALNELPRPLRQDALLFPARRGGFINLNNWRRRIWHPALASAGLERRRLYEMRHTFATLSLAAGADIYWVSKQMGHQDIRTTLRHYARFLPEVDERNLRLLDAFAADVAGGASEERHASN
jgi:integrase